MIKVTPITDSAMLPGYVRVAAEINYGRSHWWRKEQKETLWFDLPESQIEAVNRPGDGWLLALLPLAFQLGEPLRIAAQVDEQLLANATQLQNVLNVIPSSCWICLSSIWSS